jgi:hypothetical protein
MQHVRRFIAPGLLALAVACTGTPDTPAVTAPPQTPRANVAATTDHVVYSDAFGGGWEHWSWETNYVNLASPGYYAGSKSAQVSMKAYGAFSPRFNGTAFSTTEYKSLNFFVYNASGSTRLKVMVYKDDATISGSIEVQTALNTWKGFSIPWSQVGNPATVKRIAFQELSGSSSEFYFDEIKLSAATATNPPPTPPATSCSSISGLDESADYKLTVRHSGRVLDVNGAGTANGAAIQQWDYVGGDNQKWKLTSTGSGYYRITAKHSGKAVDVSGVSTTNGAELQQWDFGGGNNQQWCFSDIGTGFYKIVAKHSGKAMATVSNLLENGARIVQWDYIAANQNFHWKLEKITATTNPPSPPPSSGDAITNTLELVDQDSNPNLAHEAIPNGVPQQPGFWWRDHAAFHTTTRNSPKPSVDGAGRSYIDDLPAYNTINPWGEVYVAEGGNPAWNTRVQLKDIQLYYLSKSSNQWVQLANDKFISGGPYSENFDNGGGQGGVCSDRSVSRWFRDEADGTRSVTAGSGCQAHFWLSDSRRVDWNASDAKGVYATFKARLILNDPSGPDDRAQARYIAGVGIDYFKKGYVMTGPDDFSGNTTLGQGRFVFVQNQWRNINVSDLSLDQLRQNPPPINR